MTPKSKGSKRRKGKGKKFRRNTGWINAKKVPSIKNLIERGLVNPGEGFTKKNCNIKSGKKNDDWEILLKHLTTTEELGLNREGLV